MVKIKIPKKVSNEQIAKFINNAIIEILMGALTILPIVIVAAIVIFISNLILPNFQLLTRFVPHKDFVGNEFWWKTSSIIITLLFLWLLGKFGERINGFLDKYLSNIWVLGKLYKVVNNMVESIKNLLKKKMVTGEPISIPFRNALMPEVGYIMSRRATMWYVKGYGRVPCLPVSFATIPILKGSSPVWVPVTLIEEYERENISNKYTFEEACQFNASAGIDVPERFIIKGEKLPKEKIA